MPNPTCSLEGELPIFDRFRTGLFDWHKVTGVEANGCERGRRVVEETEELVEATRLDQGPKRMGCSLRL